MSVIWQPTLSEDATRWQALAERLRQRALRAACRGARPRAALSQENVRARWSSTSSPDCSCRRDYGGEGAEPDRTVAAVEAIGTGCSSTAAILCVYQLGAFPILLAGREEQKKFYLARDGEGPSRRASRCPSASPAPTPPRSKRPPCAKATAGGSRGEKYWIGNGGASRYYVVFAKTDPAAGGRGIRAFMVDKEQPGVVIDELCDKMGIRGTQTSNLKLDTGGAGQRARRRGQPRAAAGAADAQCRPHHGGGAVAGPGARRLSRGVAARGRAAARSAADHREPGHRLQAGRHGHRDFGGADDAVPGGARL